MREVTAQLGGERRGDEVVIMERIKSACDN